MAQLKYGSSSNAQTRPATTRPCTAVRFLETVDPAEVKKLLKAREFFWVDLFNPSNEELNEVGKLFGLHELAIEDSREFHQRPKLERYDNHALIVFYGVHHDQIAEEIGRAHV